MEGVLKGTFIGKEVLNVADFPKLQNVLYVGSLTAILISIEQLYDDGMFIKFDKKHLCVV